MGRAMLGVSGSAISEVSDFGDAFRFLAFNHGTGEILAYGPRAVFALKGADLREPHQAIEILHAGVAGKNLWQNQTPLQQARMVVDMLADSGNWDQRDAAKQRVS